MSEAALGSEVADSQWSFQSKRTAHQFPPDGEKRSIRKRSFVDSFDFFQHLFLAVGCVYLAAGLIFDLADFDDHLRTLIEELDKLVVNLVYSFSQRFKSHISLGTGKCWASKIVFCKKRV